jgi:hypothetical protein
MPMEPWYRVALPRAEVREGRSFNPNEFAIALEQVAAGRGPEDYRDPHKFFARTHFTRALREHAGMVLRRLAGHTANTAPDLTLITQFGGGKTHTLTTLYHLVKHGPALGEIEGVGRLLHDAGLAEIPRAAVGVFVGNAWDRQEGRETPWLDLAWQLAGDAGVRALGPTARTVAPGTDALARLFEAAGGRVLILCDEVLNFVNRYQELADGFYAFVQNLTVAMTGTTHGAMVLSLPRSQVEMTESDRIWQDRISKVVRRVSKDLIANDETEVSEVIRRRLFETVGRESVIRAVARQYADWCFERRAQLPPEWTAVDTAATDAKAREFLRGRFEACYPFHPATLSVFQRKWQGLPQYQQTRGTLAMFAQWISWAYRDGYQRARREPLITLGSAPLEVTEFRAVVLGQLGEPRLGPAIDTDLVGELSHARALDADTKGALKGIHRRVGLAMLFESSGGMVDQVAHLPELRFAIGEPEAETTSVDSAAGALEARAYYLRKVGTDGYRFGFKATLKKVVNDRRASLEEVEVTRAMQALVRREFERGVSPAPLFTADGSEVADASRLTLVVLDPALEWEPAGATGGRVRTWVRQRGESPRLSPGALVWCARRPGRDLRERVEVWLAWQRVQSDLAEGLLGTEFDPHERAGVAAKVRDAEGEARGEVWAGYRFVILADPGTADGVAVLDLGPGHPHGSETLPGRVFTALRSQNYLNESVAAGYVERKWPPAFKESGAWPLSGLRQAFLNGSLTRLLDVDAVLRPKIVEFVARGDFGLAAGELPGGGFSRLWFNEAIPADEVVFDGQTFLLLPAVARRLRTAPEPSSQAAVAPPPASATAVAPGAEIGGDSPVAVGPGTRLIRLQGTIPPEVWNRVGNRLLPKLRTGRRLDVSVGFEIEVDAATAEHVLAEIRQILADLSLSDRIHIG